MAQKVRKLQNSDGKDVELSKITIVINIEIHNNYDSMPINCISEKILKENR